MEGPTVPVVEVAKARPARSSAAQRSAERSLPRAFVAVNSAGAAVGGLLLTQVCTCEVVPGKAFWRVERWVELQAALPLVEGAWSRRGAVVGWLGAEAERAARCAPAIGDVPLLAHFAEAAQASWLSWALSAETLQELRTQGAPATIATAEAVVRHIGVSADVVAVRPIELRGLNTLGA